MNEMLKRILRSRTKSQFKEKSLCKNAEVLDDICIKCGRDGSIRKKNCPCLRYEARFLQRLKVAIDFVISG